MITPVIREGFDNNAIGNFASLPSECNPVLDLHAGSDPRSVSPRDDMGTAAAKERNGCRKARI
jgi:hypothetical protein